MCRRDDLKCVWARLPCCLSKCTKKGLFLDTYVTASLRVCNFGNTLAMRVIISRKCSKFNVDFKTAEENWVKVFCLCYNCIWICCIKLSLLRREYLSSEVNVWTNSLKIFQSVKVTFSNSILFVVIKKYDKGATVMIWTVFEHVY